MFNSRLIGAGNIPDNSWVHSFHFSLSMCNIFRHCLVLLILDTCVSASGVHDRDQEIQKLRAQLKALEKPKGSILSRIAKNFKLNIFYWRMDWDGSQPGCLKVEIKGGNTPEWTTPASYLNDNVDGGINSATNKLDSFSAGLSGLDIPGKSTILKFTSIIKNCLNTGKLNVIEIMQTVMNEPRFQSMLSSIKSKASSVVSLRPETVSASLRNAADFYDKIKNIKRQIVKAIGFTQLLKLATGTMNVSDGLRMLATIIDTVHETFISVFPDLTVSSTP